VCLTVNECAIEWNASIAANNLKGGAEEDPPHPPKLAAWDSALGLSATTAFSSVAIPFLYGDDEYSLFLLFIHFFLRLFFFFFGDGD